MFISFIGKLHPLLVHFPIGLVLAAAAAELAVIAAPRPVWRTVAVANIRAGAAMAVVAAITGWLFAPSVDATTPLEWHRWVGLAGATGAIGAALLSLRLRVSPGRAAFLYRCALFVSALLVAITGHLGGTIVWGASFFQP
jgi:uncharacterized membrane protein